jgi:Uma2 family endonuclease
VYRKRRAARPRTCPPIVGRGGRPADRSVIRSRDLDELRVARSLQCRGPMASTAILSDMQALLIDPDPAWLEERRRSGVDRWDEVWEGVLHVVPPPSSVHQRVEFALARVLAEIAERHELEAVPQLGMFQAERNYRQPDIVVLRPADILDHGCEGAELAVEVLSPHDESRKKLPFYASRGIPVDPVTRATEVYVLRGGTYFAVLPNRAGIVEAPRLGLELSVIDGPRLRLAWQGGSADV